MQNHLTHIKLLIQRLAVVYLMFFVTRLLFLIFNFSYFSENDFLEFVKIFSVATFFDGIPIILLNSVFIILHLIPSNVRNNTNYQKILLVLFVAVNSVLIMTNLIDVSYFKFTNKRSTFDVVALLFTGDDMKNLTPQFLKDYWYMVIIWLIIIVLMIKLYAKKKDFKQEKSSAGSIVFQSLTSVVILGLFLLTARGTGYRPASINTAAKYTRSSNIPLVLNTPFTLLKTINKTGLKERHYFSGDTVFRIINPVKQYPHGQGFKGKNVVIIILESFGKEYTGKYNHSGLTPFLDSLADSSLSFGYGFANGKKSLEAIPAVLSGLPALSDNPFILSPYSTDDIGGLAKVLKGKGYYTAFFHGGNNGTMNFDNFTLATGFDDYFGRSEYDNDNDYDGTWGIFDEPFLQFFTRKLNESGRPFLGVVFTLSSHHPFTVPEKYKDILPKGSLPIHQSVAYADLALKKFFETASKTDWYDNTVFVLTADHTSFSNSEYYTNKTGMYSIPILYYTPDGTIKPKESKQITQQIDIMPSVLDFLGYDKPFFAIGNSVFTDSGRFAINYISGVYQIFQGDFSLQFDGDSTLALYKFKEDSMLQHNVLNVYPDTAGLLERKLKAIIQIYNNGLIHNKLQLSE